MGAAEGERRGAAMQSCAIEQGGLEGRNSTTMPPLSLQKRKDGQILLMHIHILPLPWQIIPIYWTVAGKL